MIRFLPPLASRGLALAILGLLVAAVWFLAIAPVLRHDRYLSDEIEFTRDQIARLQAALPDRNTLATDMASDVAAGPDLQQYLLGETESGAAAELQRIFDLIAANSGAIVQSTQLVPTDESAELRTVKLAADLTVSHGGLLALLYALAETAPGLVVEAIDIHGPALGQVADAAAGEPMLAVRLQISGLQRPENLP